jgi:subtilisin family serine protease
VFAVTTIAGAAGENARDSAATRRAPLTVGALRTIYLALTPAEASELAADPGVIGVEAYAEPRLLDERGAQIVAGLLTPPALTQPAEPPSYRDWLLGKGFTGETFDFAVDVTDEGLDDGADPPAHPDFREGGAAAQPDRVAYLANYTSDPDARDCGGHGSNVASIAAGHGQPGSEYEDDRGFDHGMGVAPFAQVGASKIFACDGTFSHTFVPTAASAAAYAAGARVSNNSWGSSDNSYTAWSAAYDALVRDASAEAGPQPLVLVFAAGNDGFDGYGTIGAPATAKNVIAVGASESVRASGTDGCGVPDFAADGARDIVTFSSRGPTADGRLKPDLVAPGTHVTGAAPQHADYNESGVCTRYLAGTTWYSVVSGTSQATPHVTGAAALVRSWYQRTQGAAPSPALTKALLVNTATDLGGGRDGQGDTIAPGPNHDQGWGRVNVGNVVDGTSRDLRDQLAADTLTASGERRVRAYAVADPSAPVKVTLAWTDAPGTTTGAPAVNNLDLVVDAGGRTYRGNVFDGAFSRTGGSADSHNNVESVYLPAGTAERFAVRVVGTTIAGDGVPGDGETTDQDYALVVSNADASPSAMLTPDATTLDTSIAAGGDGDDALEPGERFALDVQLTNAGDAGATSVSGTLSGEALALDKPSAAGAGLPARPRRGAPRRPPERARGLRLGVHADRREPHRVAERRGHHGRARPAEGSRAEGRAHRGRPDTDAAPSCDAAAQRGPAPARRARASAVGGVLRALPARRRSRGRRAHHRRRPDDRTGAVSDVPHAARAPRGETGAANGAPPARVPRGSRRRRVEAHGGRRLDPQMSPSRRAAVTASPRVTAPSLRRTRLPWTRIVSSGISRRSAISRYVRPLGSSSRRLSSSGLSGSASASGSGCGGAGASRISASSASTSVARTGTCAPASAARVASSASTAPPTSPARTRLLPSHTVAWAISIRSAPRLASVAACSSQSSAASTSPRASSTMPRPT